MPKPPKSFLNRLGEGRIAGSLGHKLVFALTAVGLVAALGITVMLFSVINPSFARLEGNTVTDNVDRTHAALNEYAAKVESAVKDYGDWNDSYEYMEKPNAAFEKESFSVLAMQNLGVDGMAYVRPDHSIQIARWLKAGRGADDPAARERLAGMIAHTDFAKVLGAKSSGHFYARLGPAVAAIGVAKVRKSDGSGDPRGWVLMARQVSSPQLANLLQVDAALDLRAVSKVDVETPDLHSMRIAVPIVGPDGRAVASARFTVPRDVSMLGRRMLLLAIGGTVLLLVLVLFVLRRMIGRMVLKPLKGMEQHMQAVRASGVLDPLQGEETRRDEVGSLGRSFNAMLQQLKDLREQLELQSFALGRSESAVAVMHNVRNALNPISTILSQGISQPAPIDRSMVERAVGELAREDIPAARRQKLAAFVAAAVEAGAEAREAHRKELFAGREAMSHVLEIIGSQQAHAHERPPLELCDLTAIIAQNATIARYSGDMSIAFNFPAKPCHAMANRLILSQVVGNLFGNAAEAIAATGRQSGTMTVRFHVFDDRIEIGISDDGEGFAPDKAPQFFQRGFSTRAHKSGGLGLHWCANSMVAMEGSLRLESAGAGLGATAVLTLKSPEAGSVAHAA